MESLSFDTTFLIDFQRERREGAGAGAAHRFLERHRESPAYRSSVALGEFFEGFESRSDPIFLSVVESFELLDINREAALIFGHVCRHLRAQGALIGANDLWIAAVALAQPMALVTRNVEHFSRVPDLKVVSY